MSVRRKKTTKISSKTTIKAKRKPRKNAMHSRGKVAKKAKKVKKAKEKELLKISQEWDKEKVVEDNSKPIVKDNVFADNDRDKRLMMWAGVSFFMVIVLFFWIMNIKSIFKTNEIDNSKNKHNWTEMKDELNEVMEDVKKGIDEINFTENIILEENEINSDSLNSESSKEEIINLKNRLEEIERKMEGGG